MDKIECTNCNKLVKKKNMKKHLLTKKCINFSNDLSCVCDVCGKTISNRKRLGEHKQTAYCSSNKIDIGILELKRKQMIWFEKVQKIQIVDWFEYEIFEYAINNGKIYTKNRFEIGRYELWCDDENIIDKKYKDKENIVVDSNTGERLYKFIIDKQIQVFQIKLGTYTKFRYDFENDLLIFTDTIRYI